MGSMRSCTAWMETSAFSVAGLQQLHKQGWWAPRGLRWAGCFGFQVALGIASRALEPQLMKLGAGF
eukprot:1158900-Pelagomonas_calceolata.AAC.9